MRFAVVLSLFLPLATGLAEEMDFVKGGKPLAVRMEGGRWTEADGALGGAHTGNFLYASKGLAGDFAIGARLKIRELNGTAASFVLDDNHFGFDGKSGTLFAEGPDFGRVRTLGRTRDHIEPDKYFRFQAIREEGTLSFAIDGKKIWSTPFKKKTVAAFGFRPWRASMAVTDFSAGGVFIDPPPPPFELYTSGQDGYHTYRIPALITTVKGTLLAFCEGHKKSSGDTGDIDLVLKRSEDGGRTWSEMQVVWDDKGNTCGNPCPVQDRETGTVFLFSTWNLGCDHEREIVARKSKDTRRVYLLSSSDDGKHWSKPTEITKATKKPDWTWYATGPGSAIQMVNGEYKGRLVIPCDHIEAGSRRYYSHVLYSDDHGTSWHLGGTTPTDKVNECMVAERSDGTLVLNMRNYDRSKKNRAVATSTDGGVTWSALRRDETLIEPICQAALINYRPGGGEQGNWLLFSNPASRSDRVRMTLRLSRDGGKSWPVAKLLHAGPSAYSDLTVLPDGDIGCLYEGGARYRYQAIRFETVTLEALTAQK